MALMHTFRPCAFLLTAIAATLFSPPAAADQVSFQNGDRLSGTILKSDTKELIIKSDIAGEVKVPWAAVANLSTSSTAYLGLKGGEVVAGEIALAGDRVVVRTAQTGTVTSSRQNIEYIHSKDEQAVYAAEMERYRNPHLIDLCGQRDPRRHQL